MLFMHFHKGNLQRVLRKRYDIKKERDKKTNEFAEMLESVENLILCGSKEKDISTPYKLN